MKELQEWLGLTYLFRSHNLAVVSQVATRVGVMYMGRVVEMTQASTLFSHPRHPYTRMLLDAIPDLEMSGRPRTPVAGEVTNSLATAPGCASHPRSFVLPNTRPPATSARQSHPVLAHS